MAEMKGSRLRVCEWIGDRPGQLEAQFADAPSLASFRTSDPLQWLAPTPPQCHEVRDGLWALAGLPGDSPQKAGWWPPRGPVWDAVATVPGTKGRRGILLVEAKSHLAELKSPGAAAEGARLALIRRSLDEVKTALGVPPGTSWTGRYYQVANRLAYLWFMRTHGIDAWMLSVYFTGDHFEPAGNRVFPEDGAGWRQAIASAHAALALPASHPLSAYTVEAFVPAEA